MSEHAAVGKLTAQTVEQGSALIKLLAFSIALGVAPLSSYYLSLWYLWNGNATYAAITAVALANLVLITFIVMSVLEEQRATEGKLATGPKAETKKTQ